MTSEKKTQALPAALDVMEKMGEALDLMRNLIEDAEPEDRGLVDDALTAYEVFRKEWGV